MTLGKRFVACMNAKPVQMQKTALPVLQQVQRNVMRCQSQPSTGAFANPDGMTQTCTILSAPSVRSDARPAKIMTTLVTRVFLQSTELIPAQLIPATVRSGTLKSPIRCSVVGTTVKLARSWTRAQPAKQPNLGHWMALLTSVSANSAILMMDTTMKFVKSAIIPATSAHRPLILDVQVVFLVGRTE